MSSGRHRPSGPPKQLAPQFGDGLEVGWPAAILALDQTCQSVAVHGAVDLLSFLSFNIDLKGPLHLSPVELEGPEYEKLQCLSIVPTIFLCLALFDHLPKRYQTVPVVLGNPLLILPFGCHDALWSIVTKAPVHVQRKALVSILAGGAMTTPDASSTRLPSD